MPSSKSQHGRKTQTRFNWLDKVAAFPAPVREKAMLWALAYHADMAGECHPAVSTLAQESGCGEKRTAQRLLRRLEAKGIIKIIPRSVPFHANGRTLFVNRYRLILPCKTLERHDTALSCHTDEMTRQNEKMTRQNRPDDMTKQHNDMTQLCHPNPIRSPRKPISEAVREGTTALPNLKPDYQTAEIPTINDYPDIHNHDPILVAIALTEEHDKQGWGYWVKTLNQARQFYGKDKAERLFYGCLDDLYGKIKAGEPNIPGAILNMELKKVFSDSIAGN